MDQKDFVSLSFEAVNRIMEQDEENDPAGYEKRVLSLEKFNKDERAVIRLVSDGKLIKDTDLRARLGWRRVRFVWITSRLIFKNVLDVTPVSDLVGGSLFSLSREILNESQESRQRNI